VLLETRHPASIVTKSALVVRDIDILSEMAKLGLIHVALSVTSMDHISAARWSARLDTGEAARGDPAAVGGGIPTGIMAAR